MLSFEFYYQLKEIFDKLPKKKFRQNLLFSATFNEDVKGIAYYCLNNYYYFNSVKECPKTIKQKFFYCKDTNEKFDVKFYKKDSNIQIELEIDNKIFNIVINKSRNNYVIDVKAVSNDEVIIKLNMNIDITKSNNSTIYDYYILVKGDDKTTISGKYTKNDSNNEYDRKKAKHYNTILQK